jgi:hypothetical protein
MSMRESKITRHWELLWSVLAYIAIAFVVLGANPFRNETTGPFDLLVAQSGWTVEGEPVQVRHPERSDVLDALLPRWLEQRAQIRRELHPDTWNPLPAGGEPAFQNLTNGELTPAFAIFTAAPTPAIGFLFAVIFNLAMAGLGAHLWLRRRLAWLPAFFGGITVMLCGFHAAWLYWPHVLTSVWICWVLWAIDRWWEQPGYGRFCALVVTISFVLLGGFPFVTLLAAGACALYVGTLWGFDRKLESSYRLIGAVGASVAAAGLCAIPLIEFATWLTSFDTSSRHGGGGFNLASHARLLLPQAARGTLAVEATMYVGVLPLVLAGITLIAAISRLGRIGVIGVFSLLLLASGFTLVFELIPAEYLSWVPGLGSNRWTRGIVLLDFGFAVSAAWALDLLYRHSGSKLFMRAVLSVLIIVQLVDVGSFFRLFNGETSTRFFYPQHRLISIVQRDIKPFQSVIADSNFLLSGTVSAYGLPEWFGHAFKTNALKATLTKVIDNAWSSPTSTMASSGGINLEIPELSALGVRYVIGDAGLYGSGIVPQMKGGGVSQPSIALPPLPQSHWRQTVILTQEVELEAVGVRMATYRRVGLAGSVELSIRKSNGSESIAKSVIPAAQVMDNAMVLFDFQDALKLPKGEYEIIINYIGAPQTDRITAWALPGVGENCSLSVNSAPAQGCINFKLIVQDDDANFVRIGAENGIYLFENRNVPRGAYFLSNLQAYPNAVSSREVTLKRHSDTSFELMYRGKERGYLIVPMTFARGWVVHIDEQGVVPDKYLGVLPAVPVQGPTRVLFSYRPLSMVYGPWITLATLMVLILAGFLARRRRKNNG